MEDSLHENHRLDFWNVKTQKSRTGEGVKLGGKNMESSCKSSCKPKETSSKRRPAMNWNQMHEELLCREILIYEPFNYKFGTVQRGEAWNLIAESLNSLDVKPKFQVAQRGVEKNIKLLNVHTFKGWQLRKKLQGSPLMSHLIWIKHLQKLLTNLKKLI